MTPEVLKLLQKAVFWLFYASEGQKCAITATSSELKPLNKPSEKSFQSKFFPTERLIQG